MNGKCLFFMTSKYIFQAGLGTTTILLTSKCTTLSRYALLFKITSLDDGGCWSCNITTLHTHSGFKMLIACKLFIFSKKSFHSLSWCTFYPGITWTLTCLVKTWTWLDSSSCATYSVILPPSRVMWCARCSWIHHSGSPWLNSSITTWALSWWRNTPSSAWWSQMWSSCRRWMEKGSLEDEGARRNEDKGLDNNKWTQIIYSYHNNTNLCFEEMESVFPLCWLLWPDWLWIDRSAMWVVVGWLLSIFWVNVHL